MVQSIEQQAIHTIRVLAADMVYGANSGHPGTHYIYVFFDRIYPITHTRCSHGMCTYGSCSLLKDHEFQSKES
jgi:hypothetical protein